MLFAAFIAAWALRDSFGNFLVWLGEIFNVPVRGMVRAKHDSPVFYRILLSDNPLVGFKHHLWVFYLSVPAWLFFLNAQRAYDATARRTSRGEFGICAYAGMLGTAAFVVLLFLIKFIVSRLLMLNFLLFGIAFLWIGRTIILPVLQRRRRQQMRNLLIIGSQSAAEHFHDLLRTPAYRWSRMLGFISDEESEGSEGVKRLGALAQLEGILDREVVDEVVIIRSSGDANAYAWGDVLELCLQRGRTVSMVDDFVPPVGAKVEATMTGTLPTLVMHNTPQNTLSLAVKSAMDRTIAFLALLVLALPLAIIALLIKLGDGGPVLFKQKRVGLNGRLFSFYKFRSMRVDAQEVLAKMKRDEPEKYRAINIMEEPFFKAKEGDDPRITGIGRILRKYSLDELPQFWNVLRGDMSLVGPRPPLPNEVAELQPWQRRKLSVKGGLTCLWQVSGRNEITDVDEWMKLDLEYIDNWSLWLDVKLLFQTIKVMVKPRGAS
jgi:exopolysaccharide biosynthesis polyprenyl glycosylphosphotransferase